MDTSMTEGMRTMSEDKMIFCAQCGSEISATAKFCSNCGAKVEQAPAGIDQPENENVAAAAPNVYADGLYSGSDNASPYEKITDAEEIKPESVPVQEEIHINYGQPDNTGNPSVYASANQQYYSADKKENEGKGGNIGIAIASLVCGILAIICCCATTFSLLLSVASIVLGVITIVKKYDGKGMAIAGIATGGVAIVLTVLAFVSLFASGVYSDFVSDIFDELYY